MGLEFILPDLFVNIKWKAKKKNHISQKDNSYDTIRSKVRKATSRNYVVW